MKQTPHSCKILSWDHEKAKELSKILLLEKEEVIVVPSETVYGLAGNIFSKKAIEQIYRVKSRPSDNPLITHIYDEAQLKELVNFSSESQKEIYEYLQKAFWPGPLTFVLPKNPHIKHYVAPHSTIAIRMPFHKVFMELLKIVNVPLAAPSANISGRPSGTQAKDIEKELGDLVSLILEDAPSLLGIESTVVEIQNDKVTILRPGSISLEDIKRVLPLDISVVYYEKEEEKELKSPGLKYAHYRPHFSVTLWNQWPFTLIFPSHSNHAFITWDISLKEKLEPLGKVFVYENALSLSKDLYHLLYTLEEQGITELFIQNYPSSEAYALMDRLRRIASHFI